MSGTLVVLPRKYHSVKFNNPLLYFLRYFARKVLIICDVFNAVYDQIGEKQHLCLRTVPLYAYV